MLSTGLHFASESTVAPSAFAVSRAARASAAASRRLRISFSAFRVSMQASRTRTSASSSRASAAQGVSAGTNPRPMTEEEEKDAHAPKDRYNLEDAFIVIDEKAI